MKWWLTQTIQYDRILLVALILVVNTAKAADVDGGWGPFSTLISPCNKTCKAAGDTDPGYRTLYRLCTKPKPQGNGKQCVADKDGNTNTKVEACNDTPCKSGWSNWGPCSENCTWGVQKRESLCGPLQTDICKESQYDYEYRRCNRYNETRKTICPSACVLLKLQDTCPKYAICQDQSTEFEAKAKCVCQLGYEMNAAGTTCVRPPPVTPTPRPIPTLPPEEKEVAVVITKSASTVLLIFVCLTLLIFLFLRIFTVDRCIQMNMEISLGLAHIVLLFPSDTFENVLLCKILSILLHFFFTACFLFVFLEGLHMYSLIASVVRRNGFFNRIQNCLLGWGIAAAITLVSMCFSYEHYGAKYHCWLQMDTNLALAQFIPVVTLLILTFVLLEAAGSADFTKLQNMDKSQLFSARITQRVSLIILPLLVVSWILGIMSEYEQNLAMYGTFSTLNSFLGVAIFIGHCAGNQIIRQKIQDCWDNRHRGRRRLKKF